jgi:hypothetical protein
LDRSERLALKLGSEAFASQGQIRPSDLFHQRVLLLVGAKTQENEKYGGHPNKGDVQDKWDTLAPAAPASEKANPIPSHRCAAQVLY